MSGGETHTTAMTEAAEAIYRSMSDKQLRREAANARKALRAAWPHRHTSFRAPIVVRANVRCLRDLSTITS